MRTQLLVADHRAGWWQTLPTDQLGRLDRLAPSGRRSATLAEHAGVLRLPAGAPAGARAVLADDAGGALVVLDAEGADVRIPLAIPAEHLATDPSGRYVACTTGLGAAAEPWSDLVTVADLERRTAARVRVRVGEPGVAVAPDLATGQPVVVLRHREPGEVEAIPLDRLLTAGPHCPQVRGTVLPLAGHLGHGDAVDHTTGTVHLATEAGIERVRVVDGVPERLRTWPWPTSGRAYFLRFDPVRRQIVAAVRGGDPDPGRWDRWHNALATWNVADGAVEVVDTGDGLVFRPDVRDGFLAWTVVHPDGDRLVVRDPHGRLTETALPAMTAGPRPDATPWDAVDGRPAQRRAVALLDEGRVAVTRGGDGELHVVGPAGLEHTVTTGSPLDEGGHLATLTDPPGPVDGIGR